jgi:hypothetical protein
VQPSYGKASLMVSQQRLDLYELQAWEMRNAGLDSQVWVIGHGVMDFWGPMRERTARADYHYCSTNRLELRPMHQAAHPMTYRWRRW